jgi:hypothetical protein
MSRSGLDDRQLSIALANAFNMYCVRDMHSICTALSVQMR